MFNNVREQTIDWINEHGTFQQKGVLRYLPIASPSGDLLERWRRVGSVLQDIVGAAFQTGEPLRADGSRWSLSNIAQPKRLALSLSAHDVAEEVPPAWRTATYQTSLAGSGLTPMLVSGAMKIHRLNRTLALRDLALQTTGASDGQTLAGAISTGTHGAALRFGALHDAIRAVHLMVGPNEAVLVQGKSGALLSGAAQDLTNWLGFPTRLVTDDNQFHAALVHLGSLGLVLNVIIEVRPLYFFSQVTTPHTDDAWRRVLEKKDPAGLPGHAPNPSFLQVILNPYTPSPSTSPKAWVNSMTDTRFTGQPGVATTPGAPEGQNPDLLAMVSTLTGLDDLNLTDLTVRKFMTRELTARYGAVQNASRALPGVTFGPTSLPRGRGESTEFVVDADVALPAVDAVLKALESERKAGRQFLGGIAVRLVAGSDALLAPNARPMCCFIELPGIRTKESSAIYAACGAALTSQGLAYGCHWGQHLVDIKRCVSDFWGSERSQAWVHAREALLPTVTARNVFASPILKLAGLE